MPQVTDFVTLNGDRRETLIAIAGGLEQQSQHPLARAVVDYAGRHGGAAVAVDTVTELEGQGVTGMVAGKHFISLAAPLSERASQAWQRLREQGRTVSILRRGDEPVAVIGFADEVRAAAHPALIRLRQQGIVTSIILSGDNHEAVHVRPSGGRV